MSRTKRTVHSLLKTLPENCTLDEVQYHLYVLQKIQRADHQADTGQVTGHADVIRMVEKLQITQP